MELGEINSVWTLVGFLFTIIVPLFFKYLFYDKPKNKKVKKEKEKLENVIEKLKDKQQDEFMLKMDKKLDNVVDNQHEQNETQKIQGEQIDVILSKMKDTDFIKTFDVNTRSFLSKWIQQKDFKNSNIIKALFNGRLNLILLSKSILYSKFNLTKEEVYEQGYFYLKDIKDELLIKNIDGLDGFLCDFELFLEKILDDFAFDFDEYKNLDNGFRREAFEIALMKLFKSIVKTAIDNYKELA